MKRIISWSDTKAAAFSFVSAAQLRVDIFCNTYVDFAGSTAGLKVKEIILSVPRGIPVRCVVGIASEEQEDPSWSVHKSNQVFSELLEIGGTRPEVTVHRRDWWQGFHFILVDGNTLFQTSMLSGVSDHEWDTYITDEPEFVLQARRIIDPTDSVLPKLQTIFRSQLTKPILGWYELVQVSFVDWERITTDITRSGTALHSLSPRQFEEFIAELLARNGLEVHLTPTSRDGGRDILASSHGMNGDFLYLVECKRYRVDRPVGVSLVRGLYGVVEQEKATAGLLFTSSRFTKGAVEFQHLVRHRLILHDYLSTVNWVLSTMKRQDNSSAYTRVREEH